MNSKPWSVRFKPRTIFDWGYLSCKCTVFTGFYDVFDTFIHVLPVHITAHLAFRPCNLWVGDMEIFQGSMLYGCENDDLLTIYSHRDHDNVVPPVRISLTLSRYFSLSFTTSSRSSGLHPISSESCCIYVRDGRPAFAWPYVGVHRSTSLMSSSVLLQQCPACLVRLTWIVFGMGDRWPYSWRFVGCCRQDLFSIARRILV